MVTDGPSKLTTFFFQGVPAAVKNRFKAYCARRGVTMKDKLVDLMTHCIEEDADELSPKSAGHVRSRK